MCRASAIWRLLQTQLFSLCLLFPDLMSIIGNLQQQGWLTFLLRRLCSLHFICLDINIVLSPIQRFQSSFLLHLTMLLFFLSLRLISSACCMPADSFRLTGLLRGSGKFPFRVINWGFSGVGTSLLLRSSVSAPGPGYHKSEAKRS